MGFLRGGGLVIVSILLFIVFLVGGILLTLSWSLKYENVQEELGLIAEGLVDDSLGDIGEFNLTEEMDEARNIMEEYCQGESEYVFSEGGYTFTIPCDVLDEVEEDPGVLIQHGIEDIVEKIYYDEYDCGFWGCIGQDDIPFFLISEKAQKYWQGRFWLALLVAIVLIVLMFFLLETKLNLPIIVGSLLVLSSLPLTKIEGILANNLAEGSAASFVGIFFSEIGTVFWIMLIIGVVLIAGGIVWRILGKDSIKKKFSKKDIKKIVHGKKKK